MTSARELESAAADIAEHYPVSLYSVATVLATYPRETWPVVARAYATVYGQGRPLTADNVHQAVRQEQAAVSETRKRSA